MPLATLRRRAAWTAPVLALLPGVLALAGCGSGGASTAADAYISQAEDPEEREALTMARDDIDAEMRAEAERLDREIERLRKENEELKAKLAARGSGS